MAQVCRLGPKVGGHLALVCIHRVNRVNSNYDSQTLSHDDSTRDIFLVLLLLLFSMFLCYYYPLCSLYIFVLFLFSPLYSSVYHAFDVIF